MLPANLVDLPASEPGDRRNGGGRGGESQAVRCQRTLASGLASNVTAWATAISSVKRFSSPPAASKGRTAIPRPGRPSAAPASCRSRRPALRRRRWQARSEPGRCRRRPEFQHDVQDEVIGAGHGVDVAEHRKHRSERPPDGGHGRGFVLSERQAGHLPGAEYQREAARDNRRQPGEVAPSGWSGRIRALGETPVALVAGAGPTGEDKEPSSAGRATAWRGESWLTARRAPVRIR